MDNSLVRKQIGKSAFFNSITNNKFKHNRLCVHFILPLEAGEVSNNAMVALLLRKGSKNLPDFSVLNAELNRLYGATLMVDISKYNKYQRVGVGISFLDNRYAMENENLVELCSGLLLDLITNPNFNENGCFKEDILELERQYLIDTIESEINDKRSYALTRLVEEMYKLEPISIPKYGTVETAKKSTPQSVTSAWKNILKTSRIEIMFTGAGDPASALTLFENVFSKLDRSPVDYSLLRLSSSVKEVKNITETLDDLKQSKLVMGMRIPGLESIDEINAARLFGALYGGTPFSKLFLNVREKLSLCYYCSARVNTINNLLVVDSGVENQNIDKAKEEILKQLNSIKNGELAEEEIENTKMLLENAIKSTNDSLAGLESWYLGQILEGKTTSPEEDISALNNITKEQIVAVSQGVALDTVYLLKGKES